MEQDNQTGSLNYIYESFGEGSLQREEMDRLASRLILERWKSQQITVLAAEIERLKQEVAYWKDQSVQLLQAKQDESTQDQPIWAKNIEYSRSKRELFINGEKFKYMITREPEMKTTGDQYERSASVTLNVYASDAKFID